MEKFCKDLKEHATNLISCEKNDKILLTTEENRLYLNQKFVIYAKRNLVLMMIIKNIIK